LSPGLDKPRTPLPYGTGLHSRVATLWISAHVTWRRICFSSANPQRILTLNTGPSSLLLLESLESLAPRITGSRGVFCRGNEKQIEQKNAEKTPTYLELDLQVTASSNDLSYLQKGEHREVRNRPGACGEGRRVRRGGACRGLVFACSQSRIWG